MLTALSVAAGGNVTGGLGEFAQNASVAYLQKLGANQVKQIADNLGSEEARAALHAIIGCAGAAASSQSCGAGAMGAASNSVLGSLLAPSTNLSASEREARDNLVTSLVAGVAAVSGQDVATATGAGKIEVENNQVAPIAPAPGWLAGFKLPGYKGETAAKGDGVIADPATTLDPAIKPTGSLIYPMPDAKTVGDWITAIIPDQVKGLVDYIVTATRWKRGDDVYTPTAQNNDPSWSAVRSRFWKNEAESADAAAKYGAENLARMKDGLAPQRYNPDKGGMESMELSHEPVPARDGGKEFVPRWPQDHATVDPYRRPGY